MDTIYYNGKEITLHGKIVKNPREPVTFELEALAGDNFVAGLQIELYQNGLTLAGIEVNYDDFPDLPKGIGKYILCYAIESLNFINFEEKTFTFDENTEIDLEAKISEPHNGPIEEYPLIKYYERFGFELKKENGEIQFDASGPKMTSTIGKVRAYCNNERPKKRSSFGNRKDLTKLSDLDSHGYYNKTIHTCVLKLHLPLKLINEIYTNLYNKNEISGVFYVDNDDNVTHVDKNEGDAGSVYTPNNVINYHTHPINAYRNGKTCYGWPSGEDFRETLKFALAGNKAHIVFTVEGLYTIQVSPCKIKKIKELLNDIERGILIFFIEEYFKTTHDIRCTEELNNLSEGNNNITPHSFIDFANHFDIPNLLSPKKIIYKKPKNEIISNSGHTGINSSKNKFYTKLDGSTEFSKIPNMGFVTVTDDHLTTLPANKILTHEELENLRKISNLGEESDSDEQSIHKLLQILKSIAKKLNVVPCNIEWNSNPNAWFFVNFFPTEHFIKNTHKKNNTHIMPSLSTKQLYLTHEPFVRIFSNSKSGCKIKNIAKTHNFKSAATTGAFNMGKLFKYGLSMLRKSTFGNYFLSEIAYLRSL